MPGYVGASTMNRNGDYIQKPWLFVRDKSRMEMPNMG